MALEHITNFPTLERVGANMVRIVVESDDHVCNLCWEIERFEAWLDYANAQVTTLKLHKGAKVQSIR